MDSAFNGAQQNCHGNGEMDDELKFRRSFV
jgi:hypothetical protein